MNNLFNNNLSLDSRLCENDGDELKNITVGVLALQGAFIEHIHVLQNLNAQTREVRLPKDLNDLNGLIIPGGESTTIARLIHEWNLYQPILDQVKKGMAIWGTCAGTILLAKHSTNLPYKTFGLMDIEVDRNAFGRQIDSFEENINCPALGKKPFHAVFIRAPLITEIGKKVKVIAKLNDKKILAAEQNNFLATVFHPELTGDNRFHQYFLQQFLLK